MWLIQLPCHNQNLEKKITKIFMFKTKLILCKIYFKKTINIYLKIQFNFGLAVIRNKFSDQKYTQMVKTDGRTKSFIQAQIIRVKRSFFGIKSIITQAYEAFKFIYFVYLLTCFSIHDRNFGQFSKFYTIELLQCSGNSLFCNASFTQQNTLGYIYSNSI